MSDGTTTIAVRVENSTKQQIRAIANANGLSTSDWVREQIMPALYAASAPGVPVLEKPTAPSDSQGSLLQSSEARILRDEIAAVKTAVAEAAKSHHGDLCKIAQVGATVEESMEERIAVTRAEVLGAIEGLMQAQESHNDTLLTAIAELRRLIT